MEAAASASGKAGPAPPDLTGTITLADEHPVASGGYGDVYRGTNADGLVVAVKVMRINATGTVILCFERETKFWHTVDHPHVLKFLGTCMVGRRPGLVSLWLDNGTAPEFIRKEPTADCFKILRQTGLALEYLHSRGIVHGDIKGANILIDKAGNAFLADFGLARMREKIAGFTTTPSILGGAGSTRYMAPELLLGEVESEGSQPLDRTKADVYAFGCTILELVTGERPFSEIVQESAVMLRVIRGQHPRRPPVFHPSLWNLCEACWRFDPAARPTMPQVVQKLGTAAENSQSPSLPSKSLRKVGLGDFNFLAMLSRTQFVQVMLAEEKESTQLHAIKVFRKDYLVETGAVEKLSLLLSRLFRLLIDTVISVWSEMRVFLTAVREQQPFLLALHSCFQTDTRVYFVMEYVDGGNLLQLIQHMALSVEQARFYACEVLLALECLHRNGIIHRSVSSENVLLTSEGHVKLADYTSCKEKMWFGIKTSSFLGTPEFIAPEIILEAGYTRAVDWWSFGVLLYQMLTGQYPFALIDEIGLYKAILNDRPSYPSTLSDNAISVLQQLLTREPTQRLGAGRADAEEVKQALFFHDVNWEDVLNLRIRPPYHPALIDHSKTNFQETTQDQLSLTPIAEPLSERDQREFDGFSWVSPWANG